MTNPIVESGVNDDWSYTKSALDLARTGHLLYNGWSAAMLGAQAYWGALFIKLFGFSFSVVRLSVAPLAAGCAMLLYVLHRRAGLPAGLASFGALATAVSPFFIPHAASFMTEIPALFLFLLSLYGYVRAADALEMSEPATAPTASWRIRVCGWLLFGLAAGLIGGTVRQVDWLVPILAPAFLLWRSLAFRRFRPAPFPLVVAGLVAVAGSIAFSAWFHNQPYTIHEKVAAGVTRLFDGWKAAAYLCALSAMTVQTLGLAMFPLLTALPWLYRRWLVGQRLAWLRLGGAFLAAACIGFLAWLCYGGQWVFVPLGNTFGIFPFMSGAALAPPGSIPLTLPLGVWAAFYVAGAVLVCGTLALRLTARVWPRRPTTDEQPRERIPAIVGLLCVFSAAYVPLLLLKGLVPDSLGVYDRYLLPVFPLATIGFLLAFRQWTGRDRFPLASWFALALFAFYGVAQSHDYFAQLRARVSLTGYLEERAIPRTRIMAGFEYDGWTQLEVAGHYNDRRIEKPEGIYLRPPRSLRFVTIYSFCALRPWCVPTTSSPWSSIRTC